MILRLRSSSNKIPKTVMKHKQWLCPLILTFGLFRSLKRPKTILICFLDIKLYNINLFPKEENFTLMFLAFKDL